MGIRQPWRGGTTLSFVMIERGLAGRLTGKGPSTEITMGDEVETSGTASAYATGGGGVVLEHAYGGALLVELLLGGPVDGLGDNVTPTAVGFQQSVHSRVDDLEVVGDGPGGPRTLFVGVRRKPSIGASQEPTVKLVADYLRVVNDHGAELEAGSWRLGLAVAAPHTPTDELAKLAYFARRQPDSEAFRLAVNASKATTGKVRNRLAKVDDTVAAAAPLAGITLVDTVARDELSWRLLRSLHIIDLRLEGDDAAGRTDLVARLVPLAGDAAAAEDLRRHLNELSAGYAVGAAVVNEGILRRDLSGRINVAASPSFRASWEALRSLEDSLHSRTRRVLTAGRSGSPVAARQLVVERQETRAKLIEAMGATGGNAGRLVVHGEPGVGKSALVLAAAEEIRRGGGAVVALSLRDLVPASMLSVGQLLHAPVCAVFAATAAAPVRLVILDGAEVVQEGAASLLRDLAGAAREAGLGLVAVTRDDARAAVQETLAETVPDVAQPETFDAAALAEVPPLGDDETCAVRETFAELNRLASDDRSQWLLRRLGILDVLLRGEAIASLPDGSLSEADVFGAVWYAWVRRRDQRSPGGASPDGREQVMLELARRSLAEGSGPATAPMMADPYALPSLRSDGLLLPAGPQFAFRQGDEFSTDTVRDFALARLFLREGFDSLRETGAPRRALRAARLACQARLVQVTRSSAGPVAVGAELRELQQQFDALAVAFGDRWADLPWEAALSAGPAEAVIEACASDLLQPDGDALSRVLRLLMQRFSAAGATDPVIAAPVVTFLVSRAGELREANYGLAEQAENLIRAWLRGVSRAERAPGGVDGAARCRPLRAKVREYLLHLDPPRSEVKLESLALLGAEADAEVVCYLRGLAANQPGLLAPCIEPFDATMSLAAAHLDLLFELTEAYYIDKTVHRFGFAGFDDGIRRHRFGPGIGVPFASWLFGPFWLLLPAAPVRALALINRMMDHAARYRIRPRDLAPPAQDRGDEEPDSPQATPGVTVNMPGVGERHYTGDDQVWAWYRGTSIGPYPCMSALLATEQFADQLLAQGMPLPQLVVTLLRDGHNLAMLGLVTGFLVRHADRLAGEADPLLASPAVWELEASRAAMEGGIHAAGRDDPQNTQW
jgi:Mrp family chromosome partitioning ATPase